MAVLVVEQTPVQRRGLEAILAEALDGHRIVSHDGRGGIDSLLNVMDEVVADLLVLDGRALFGLGAPSTVVDVVLRVWPGLGILLFTEPGDPSLVAAVHAGARGVASREAEAHEIGRIAREVASGGSSFSADLARLMLGQVDRMAANDDAVPLSAREIEVLRKVGEGLTNQQIGDRLGISINTVKNHLRKINEKTGVTNRTEAAMLAVRRGWG